MQFFPHNNTNASLVGRAESSSFSLSGSFLNNFASVLVDTASLALNIYGTPGTNGASFAVSGPKGAKGEKGVKGFRGNSIFLLSGSWADDSACTGPTVCNSVVITRTNKFGDCTLTGTNTYYSTNTTVSVQQGSFLYYDSLCTSPLGTITFLGRIGKILYETTNGTASVSDTSCPGGPF